MQNAKNLPINVVDKTNLRPRFVRPFTVVTKKSLAYTLNLPYKLRTLSVCVSMMKPYRNPSHVNVETLPLRALTYKLGRQDDHPSVNADVTASAAASVPPPSCSESDKKSHGDVSSREATQRALAPIHRPPPALLDEQGIFSYMWRNIYRSVVTTVNTSKW